MVRKCLLCCLAFLFLYVCFVVLVMSMRTVQYQCTISFCIVVCLTGLGFAQGTVINYIIVYGRMYRLVLGYFIPVCCSS